MRVLIACEEGALGVMLARRAADAGADVRLAAGAAVAGARSLAGVRHLDDPVSALEAAADVDVVVVLPRRASAVAPGPLARALARVVSRAPEWRRLVYWGSHRVYAPAGPAPIRPWLEDAALVAEGPWSEWSGIDAALRAAAVRENFLFRAVPLAGPAETAWVDAIRRLPLVPVARHDVPVQLLHTDDALEILWRATTGGHPGVYNACGDGLLFLRRVVRRIGRLPLPLPRAVGGVLLAPGRILGRPASLREALAGGYDAVVLDNARLKTHFGYRPRRTAAQALAAVLVPISDRSSS